MKWLFFYMIFDVSGGGLQPRLMVEKVFNTEAECNKLGREIAREFGYEDKSLKSFSICIPEIVYSERVMKVERLDR
jgi:hypothetical protein